MGWVLVFCTMCVCSELESIRKALVIGNEIELKKLPPDEEE